MPFKGKPKFEAYREKTERERDMKEIQTERKHFARNSGAGNKRLKDSELKNGKLADKRQSAPFSDASSDISKEPVDFAPISGSISDCDAESIVQGSCSDLALSTPEKLSPADLSPNSTISNLANHADLSVADRARLITDLPLAVKSLRVEVHELKKLIYPSDLPEEKNPMDEIITAKYRIVLLAFTLWAVLALIVFFVSSGRQVPHNGPLPT